MSAGSGACPQCGAATTDGQRFCGACGTTLATTCPACAHDNPPGFRFCGSCGSALDATPAAAVAPTEERRWATVVFADLSGFTSMSEHTDVEDVRSLVDRCMDALGAIASQFDGAIDSVSGDQIMVVFGAPVAHEDDPDRAVRCALEMIDCAERNAEDFGGLPLRIGVNTGEMMFAPVGPQGARQHTIMGDAVNVGARLQAAAPRSGVLVGDATYRASRHAIAYEGPIAVQAKGKDEPVTAWRATGVIAAPAERPVSAGPLVGRNAVLGQLHNLWKRVTAEERPHLVTVLGQPGIGKTRLSQELAAVIAEQGGRVVRGRSQPYGELLGYGAFAQQVKSVVGILDTDPPDEARARLNEFLEGLGITDVDALAERLAVLVGLAQHAVADRQGLFHAARSFIETLASSQPLLLIFEDIHWADESLLDLISSLAARVRDAPLMLLTLARPELLERSRAWGGGLESYTALQLAPLTDEDAISLVKELTSELDPAVARQVADAAAGNPLFIEELAASLNEGRVGRDLPTSVKALIASRLDALPPEERRLLLDASVLGKVFWRGALERLSGGGAEAALDSLEARDLIRRERISRIEADTEYTFKHILIREVAYATLPRPTRRDRHGEVARFLENAAGERTAEWATMLAHHWLEAGDRERAVEYLVMAAESASRAWAKGEAVRLYADALELLEPDDPRRLSMRRRRAALLVESTDTNAAVAELDEIIPRLDGRERLEALLVRGRAAYWLVDTEAHLRIAAECEMLASEIGDPELHAASLGLSLEAAAMQGRLKEVVDIGARALHEWPRDARPDSRAVVRALLGLSHYWLGNAQEALNMNMEAYREGIALHNVEVTLSSGAQVGISLTANDRHEEALTWFADVVDRGREMELVPRLTSRTINSWAGTLAELGDYDGAQTLNEEGIELAARAAFSNGLAQGKVDIVFWHIARGNIGTADGLVPEIVEEAEKLRGWHEWLIGTRLATAQAEILLGGGRLSDAVDAAHLAIDRCTKVGRAKYESRARVALGHALMGLGRGAEAVAELRAALDTAETMGHARSIWTAAAPLSAGYAAIGDDAQAEVAAARARAALDRFAASLSPEWRARVLASAAVASQQ